MKGVFYIRPDPRFTKVVVRVNEEAIEGGIAEVHSLGIQVPNEQWEHFIFTEATRLGFQPQISIPTT